MANKESIKELMQKHDWFFEYADDMRDWRKGSSEKQAILSLMRKIPMNQIPELMELVPQELKQKWFIELQNVALSIEPNNNSHPPQEDESW